MSISLFVWLWPTLVAFLLLLALSRYDWAWQRRRVLSEAVIGLEIASIPFLFTTDYDWWLQILLALTQVWIILLACRLLFGRLPEQFIRSSTHFNSVVAIGIFIVVMDSWLLARLVGFDGLPHRALAGFFLLFGFVVGLGMLYQIVWTLKHYRLRNLDQNLRMKDLPTVTLAIPARNETHALEACLRAAIASDYPKLEIIVLDDCSQDKTSDIIRSFAHDGVRFVQGAVPAEGWLGKNQALNTLYEQANGDFILFADVDTHLEPQSISKLVRYALSNHLEMVTVLPYRRDGWSWATVLTSLRYFWQVAMPVTARRVPVASQCWLVRRLALKKLGGFNAVRQKIVPEAYFARILFVHDTYRFVISNEEVGVSTAKRWSSQAETAIRFLYPTCKRQPVLVLLGCVLLLGLMLLPFIVLTTLPTDPRILMPAALTAGVFLLCYGMVAARTHPLTWPVTVIFLPFSLVQELILLVVSMLMYEFGDVNWKGRNVCYPVIRQR